jgi:enoyl-CoA hydratase/carnithine racemase
LASKAATADLVRVEHLDRIVRISLNNPPFNAASLALVQRLHRALDAIETEPRIRCVILTGAGERAFCAGADIREESRFRDPAASREFRALGRRTLDRIEGYPKPIVAAIAGWCIGGGTALGWSCDLRFAADTAKFRAGDAYLGVVPSWGMGLTRLPRLVGRANALDILLLGEDMSAARAYQLGLVTAVVPAAELQQRALAAAQRIAQASPAAILATRQAIAFNLRHRWDEMVVEEEAIAARIFNHPDSHEGMAAFLEKRSPVFQDLTETAEGKP